MIDQRGYTELEIMSWLDFAIEFIKNGEPEVAKNYLENIKRVINNG